MPYSVKQLATLSGVSVRTLHFYDEAGLLTPSRAGGNGYRQYGEDDLLRLQQVLFFRELEFSVADIKRILSSPAFDMRKALTDHKHLIELKRRRLTGLIRTIEKTLGKMDNKNAMQDEELYGDFSKEKMEEYAAEAKRRWGNTEAWKQSQERYAKMTKEDIARLKADADTYMKKVAETAGSGVMPQSPEMQELIGQHYDALRAWYEPNLVMYRGLADMYVADPRFAAYYEKYRPGLARFMHDAMHAYADAQEKKTTG